MLFKGGLTFVNEAISSSLPCLSNAGSGALFLVLAREMTMIIKVGKTFSS